VIVEHVGRHAANDERCVVVDEDRGGNLRPRSRKFTTADFEARGGHLRLTSGCRRWRPDS